MASRVALRVLSGFYIQGLLAFRFRVLGFGAEAWRFRSLGCGLLSYGLLRNYFLLLFI